MPRLFAFILGLVVLVVGGFVHGTVADRWGNAPALDAALSRMPKIPHQIGEWTGEDSQHISAKDFTQTGALQYVVRMYKKPGAGPVEVILMCGRPGRMSVHTPEVCYRGVGYDLHQAPQIAAGPMVDGHPSQFWRGTFTKPNAKASDLQLYWSWNAGGVWKAPENPRWAFMGEPFLFKLYVSQNRTNHQEVDRQEMDAFLRQFLPVLQETLFTDS